MICQAPLSLSDDGNTVAIGAPGHSSSTGRTRMFRLNGSSQWVQIGQSIDGGAANDSSGDSVSLSDDGNTVAVGATGYSSDTGRSCVYN